jgi:hypothetical protein
VTGGNPYSQAEMSSLEDQIYPDRFSATGELINTWNPPWLILVLVPLGLFPFSVANLLWVFCNVLLIGAAILLTWKMCVGDQKSRGILFAYLACFLYVETVSYLKIGQITGILLLGIVLTIWFIKHDMDFWAGSAALLTTIKPHITYFFLLLLLIWVLQNRRWKVIVGLATAALVSMVIFWIASPGLLSDYIFLVTHLPFNQLYTSTLGSFVLVIFDIPIFKYAAVLLVFAIKPLLKIIKNESWLTATNLALLLSVPISPYGFSFDHIVILPAIVQLISWAALKKITRNVIILIAFVLVVWNIVLAYMYSTESLEYYWFFWTPIPVLVIYLIAWKGKNASQNLAH